jgi:hypothetical protein
MVADDGARVVARRPVYGSRRALDLTFMSSAASAQSADTAGSRAGLNEIDDSPLTRSSVGTSEASRRSNGHAHASATAGSGPWWSRTTDLEIRSPAQGGVN